MKNLLLTLAILQTLNTFCQEETSENVSKIINAIAAKEFNKEVSLYLAKAFLVDEIIKPPQSGASIQFYVDPLAAATSGELTTLIFDCQQMDVKGLILGFYGNYWDINGTGIDFTGYSFKYVPDDVAIKMFDKIDREIEKNEGFLNEDMDNNNICFVYDDITFVITRPAGVRKIRLFWNGFDSEWEETTFRRTVKRYYKKS